MSSNYFWVNHWNLQILISVKLSSQDSTNNKQSQKCFHLIFFHSELTYIIHFAAMFLPTRDYVCTKVTFHYLWCFPITFHDSPIPPYLYFLEWKLREMKEEDKPPNLYLISLHNNISKLISYISIYWKFNQLQNIPLNNFLISLYYGAF